ncbi:hypothetical protein D9M71_813000 [compost metagenome]
MPTKLATANVPLSDIERSPIKRRAVSGLRQWGGYSGAETKKPGAMAGFLCAAFVRVTSDTMDKIMMDRWL